jgi:hypothetical protein
VSFSYLIYNISEFVATKTWLQVKCLLLGSLSNAAIDCSFADEDLVKLSVGVRHCLKGSSNVKEPAVTKLSQREVEGVTAEAL